MRGLAVSYIASITLLGCAAVTGGIALYERSGPGDVVERAATEHGYSLTDWEITKLPRKWLYKVSHLIDRRTGAEEERFIEEYFADDTSDVRRSEIEDLTEEIIEGRMTAILEEQGLALKPPLFGDLGLIFPPVDFELDTPPRLLVVSPRNRISLDQSYLLTPGISAEAVSAIEREAESENAGSTGVSALVINTGGLAAYPSIVSELDNYDSLIDTVFHEWLHQYLSFFPLGSSYTRNSETRTLNESVANIGGSGLAALYFQRYDAVAPDSAPVPARPPDEFDFTAEMRKLRREVESLLSNGDIRAAEELMSEKRDEFEAKGFFIRRLNQAYFAFHGSYADTPGSIDPIGPKLGTLLDRAGSPGEFVRRASGITTAEELEALLAKRS